MLFVLHFLFPSSILEETMQKGGGIQMAQATLNIRLNEAPITREGAMQAFAALRTEAKANGVSDMSTDDINKEIDLARKEAKA